jgi:hypothetical protein
MITGHPTEEQVHAHALDPAASPAGIHQHIGSCETCQASASRYRILFSALRDQPEPVFDFDVAELVLSALPSPKTKRSWTPYLSVMMLVVITGIPIYLFKENIVNLFSGMSQFFAYVSVGSALIFLLVRLVQIIKTYHKRFDILNHFPDLQPYSGKRV